jgi:hypothetical protein
VSLLFITYHVAIAYHPALKPIEARYAVSSQCSSLTPSSLFCGVQLGAFVVFMMDGEADELLMLNVNVEFVVISKTQFEKMNEEDIPKAAWSIS